MNKIFFAAFLVCLSVPWIACESESTSPKSTIYRDTYGVPHIYAPSESAAAYAHGYAQAEDRPEQVLRHYRWPVRQARGDLNRRHFVQKPKSRGSNQWVLAGERTALEVPMALIDPHLSWHDSGHCWEVRIHAGDMHVAGMVIPGLPYVALGHTRRVSWAATTGGPDCGDIYVEQMDPRSPLRYRYDNEWRTMTVDTMKLAYREDGRIKVEIRTVDQSHHGPIVKREEDKAYAMAIPYANEVMIVESIWRMNTSQSVDDMREALAMQQLLPQNWMMADVHGNIYYQRTGRVPIRPGGFDFSFPVPGNNSNSEWLGIHPTGDLVQILNPVAGYMQNCNISPGTMIHSGAPPKSNYPDYIFNDSQNRSNPRGRRAVVLLKDAYNVDVESALAMVFDSLADSTAIGTWQRALRSAFGRHGSAGDRTLERAADLIVNWDHSLSAGNTTARLYLAWFREVAESGNVGLNDVEQNPSALLAALSGAIEFMEKTYGKIEVPWGESDDPESPHFTDQMELLSQERMKPTRFHWKDLEENIINKLTLEMPPMTEGEKAEDSGFEKARENGVQANEGFKRCSRYVQAWLDHSDPETGLIPRNLEKDRDIWNAKDSAADNYCFMVLTAAITDRALFKGRMHRMLRAEKRLTSRMGTLPDTYSFSKRGFFHPVADVDRIIFGSSEYVKDGLLPLTEWLGESPWSQRLIELVDGMWASASIQTRYGRIISENIEVNGEMLQVLSRIFWMTGDRKYLEWALRLGDYYLLGEHHPTQDRTKLRLRDHGCEIVSGLCELYATVAFALPNKKQEYQEPIHHMLDRILEVGRNKHGLLYDEINPKDGKPLTKRLADTWGYTYNGFLTVYLIDGTASYRNAVLEVLSHLNGNYRNYDWEGSSADGYADAIESAINLYNREPIPSVAEWIDSETQVMWKKQKPNGIIEGWHGDGNFARTTIMYCLWKTKGITVHPWREDVVFGAEREGDALNVTIVADEGWDGKIRFDTPRHRSVMNMPLDWPRINQFPEWFTVESDKRYTVNNLTAGSESSYAGRHLSEGTPFHLEAGITYNVVVREER